MHLFSAAWNGYSEELFDNGNALDTIIVMLLIFVPEIGPVKWLADPDYLNIFFLQKHQLLLWHFLVNGFSSCMQCCISQLFEVFFEENRTNYSEEYNLLRQGQVIL